MKIVGGISCEKSRFYAKKSYFFQLRREARKLLWYFVWKITILRQKIIIFPILGGRPPDLHIPITDLRLQTMYGSGGWGLALWPVALSKYLFLIQMSFLPNDALATVFLAKICKTFSPLSSSPDSPRQLFRGLIYSNCTSQKVFQHSHIILLHDQNLGVIHRASQIIL